MLRKRRPRQQGDDTRRNRGQTVLPLDERSPFITHSLPLSRILNQLFQTQLPLGVRLHEIPCHTVTHDVAIRADRRCDHRHPASHVLNDLITTLSSLPGSIRKWHDPDIEVPEDLRFGSFRPCDRLEGCLCNLIRTRSHGYAANGPPVAHSAHYGSEGIQIMRSSRRTYPADNDFPPPDICPWHARILLQVDYGRDMLDPGGARGTRPRAQIPAAGHDQPAYGHQPVELGPQNLSS